MCLLGSHLCLLGGQLCLLGWLLCPLCRQLCLLGKHLFLFGIQLGKIFVCFKKMCLAKYFVPRNLIPRFQHFPTPCSSQTPCILYFWKPWAKSSSISQIWGNFYFMQGVGKCWNLGIRFRGTKYFARHIFLKKTKILPN